MERPFRLTSGPSIKRDASANLQSVPAQSRTPARVGNISDQLLARLHSTGYLLQNCSCLQAVLSLHGYCSTWSFLRLTTSRRNDGNDDSPSTQRYIINLTRTHVPFDWTDKCEEHFPAIKRALLNFPVLRFPNFIKDLYLSTDASDFAISAVLEQKHGNDLHPV